MSKWVNQFTCPGYMCVPRKPWPFGNEYHTICCGESGLLYCMEMVEGKDTPPELPPAEYEFRGKTVGLLLRLTKTIWGTGRLVILDSGFCVLEGIVALRRKGVFASALIKKRQHWPKFIPGDMIVRHFDDKDIGESDAYKGTLNGVDFHVYAMKEPNYVMQLMSTYGTLEAKGKMNERIYEAADGRRQKVLFQYPEVVSNHYQYRDAVDSHNCQRMYPIALEESWRTMRWATRVFQFLLAVTEVNVRLADEYLYHRKHATQLELRRMLAKDLIFNHYYDDERKQTSLRPARVKRSIHSFEKLPPHKTWKGDRMINCRTKCIQLKCSFCHSKRTNAYCNCSPGVVLCHDCFVVHCLEAQSPS
jgi:hypothetical protein